MFSFLQPRDRGRKDDRLRAYSPFGKSPEVSRDRPSRNSLEDGEDGPDDEEEEDEGADEFSPLNRERSYFDRRNGQPAQGDAIEDDEIDEDEDENEDAIDVPLLPIFSAAHLDKLPLYNITHAIRLLIVQRAETTLSWEQLRSPQISQFLVKPIQNQIRQDQFNRATLCALIANCLQFQKEAQLQPGNVGVLTTRALISELLAMRLIKEFTTRELIDALSYDFDPLQGMLQATQDPKNRTAGWRMSQDLQGSRTQAKGARVSTIEIAIRAQAKRFLSHQLVVQHLEAIWAGTIVFHSEADSLHRKPATGDEPLHRSRSYGTLQDNAPNGRPAEVVDHHKSQDTPARRKSTTDWTNVRRSVTLYNPREASLFKLSRLRVPRYRQVFSTLSFAIMLGLFLAVLVERSLYITPLEVVFWFWSIGYMLDEVVGFTEQGFGLYILSFWNAFDLGILLLFVIYYCLRLYGIVLAEEGKHRIADAAYDVLSSTAILLFPRLFSVLDHYRYFSQLLIAFRLMAQDLMAILFLILISCSGFLVAFTLSFSDKHTHTEGVAYMLFQILMGFTPAAWEVWDGFNLLGKALMTAFLIICHFVIVTILITVLTNSFMAIVKNANEEHQFLFAVNTISMVKSDALFSYIAPTNVVGWVLSPLRYLLPFRRFIKVNRTVIKFSHAPVLFIIFGYERMIMSKAAYEPIDLVEKRARKQHQPIAFSIHKAEEVFTPGRRLLREPSVISFHKDRALAEVFRKPFKGSTVKTTPRDMEQDPRKTTNVVNKWMQAAEVEGGASPPIEQPRSVVDRLENRKPLLRQLSWNDRSRKLGRSSREFSSDPDIYATLASRRPGRIEEEGEGVLTSSEPLAQETDADGDDEHNPDSDVAGPAIGESAISVIDRSTRLPQYDSEADDYYPTPTATKFPFEFPPDASMDKRRQPNNRMRGNISSRPIRPQANVSHNRKISTDTALFAPQIYVPEEPLLSMPGRSSRPVPSRQPKTAGLASSALDTLGVEQATRRAKAVKPRPIMPPRHGTAPDLLATTGFSFLDRAQSSKRPPSFNARALDLASDIGDNKWVPISGGLDGGGISGMPNSFSEQMLREREFERRREEDRRRTEDEQNGMMNRLMLTRMHTLEEGFREVLREIKVISHSTTNSSKVGSEVGAADAAAVRLPRTPGRRPPIATRLGATRQDSDQSADINNVRIQSETMDFGVISTPSTMKRRAASREDSGSPATDGKDNLGTAFHSPVSGRSEE